VFLVVSNTFLVLEPIAILAEFVRLVAVFLEPRVKVTVVLPIIVFVAGKLVPPVVSAALCQLVQSGRVWVLV
jgi:hypothetical protein